MGLGVPVLGAWHPLVSHLMRSSAFEFGRCFLCLRFGGVQILKEVQKVNPRYKDLETLLLGLIREEYAKTPKGKSQRVQ